LEAEPEKRCALTDISRALQAPPLAAASPPATVVSNASKGASFGSYAEPSGSSGARLLKLAGAFLLVLAAIYFGSRIFHGRAEEPAATAPAATQPASSAAENAATPAFNTAAPVSSSPTPAKAANPASKRGAVLASADPGVSASARATITGKIRVRARVKVDASGNVTEAHLESPGPSRYFANKALESARRWKFTPPDVDGQPVASEWRLHFEFSRTGTHMSGDPLTP
jgi:TonB family protein